MKTMLCLVMLSLALVAIYPTEGTNCVFQCYPTVPICQPGENNWNKFIQNLLFKFFKTRLYIFVISRLVKVCHKYLLNPLTYIHNIISLEPNLPTFAKTTTYSNTVDLKQKKGFNIVLFYFIWQPAISTAWWTIATTMLFVLLLLLPATT